MHREETMKGKGNKHYDMEEISLMGPLTLPTPWHQLRTLFQSHPE